MGIRSLSSASISTGTKRSKFWDQSTALNSYEAIETYVVGSGGTSSVVLGSGGTIPQIYKHLQIRYIGRDSAASGPHNTLIRFNGDTGNNYTDQFILAQNASVSSGSTAAQSSIPAAIVPAQNVSANFFGINIIDIFDYSSSSKRKTVQALTGFNGSDNGVRHRGGVWMSTSPITSITIFSGSAGTLQENSYIALYGMRA